MQMPTPKTLVKTQFCQPLSTRKVYFDDRIRMMIAEWLISKALSIMPTAHHLHAAIWPLAFTRPPRASSQFAATKKARLGSIHPKYVLASAPVLRVSTCQPARRE